MQGGGNRTNSTAHIFYPPSSLSPSFPHFVPVSFLVFFLSILCRVSGNLLEKKQKIFKQRNLKIILYFIVSEDGAFGRMSSALDELLKGIVKSEPTSEFDDEPELKSMKKCKTELYVFCLFLILH